MDRCKSKIVSLVSVKNRTKSEDRLVKKSIWDGHSGGGVEGDRGVCP